MFKSKTRVLTLPKKEKIMFHFRFFILIFALLLGGILYVSQQAQAAELGDSTSAKCCNPGETFTKKNGKLSCCKGSKEDGKLSDDCCKAAGGEPKTIDGVKKCCKCKDEKCGQK